MSFTSLAATHAFRRTPLGPVENQIEWLSLVAAKPHSQKVNWYTYQVGVIDGLSGRPI